jgi:hypothetical protein
MDADERNPPPLGRIGEPDDIIGSVRVEGGTVSIYHLSNFGPCSSSRQVLEGTYSPMPAYRLATADGVVTLTPGVAEYLLSHLSELASPNTL